MKWSSLFGSLVLGLAVCTTGYSFELLDMMLGSSGCGCESSCCETKCCKSRCHRGCGKGCNDGCNNGCAKAAPNCAAPAPTCAAPAPACGCDGPAGKAAVGGGEVAPMPPAPVVDPSAFIPTQRRVVQASNSLVR